MRYLITVVIAALSLNAFGQVPNYVPSDGLVAWYPFNGNANDESGVSANGEVFSAELTADRFGTPDEAYYFSGVGCSPHIETDIDFQGSTEGMTISFWLNRQGSGCSYPRLFGFWSGGNNPQSWGMAWGNSANLDYVQESPPNEEWHHIVVTLTSESIHSYLNGSFNGAYGSTKQPPLASYMAIGRMTHPAYDAFNGFMDDIGIWNRALTEVEIEALYTADIPTSGCTDETACNFDQDATVDDCSCIPSGCIDTYACNFNSEAECEGEACDYTCCPGPGCCGVGMNWNSEIGECEITNPTDSNLDGCTDLNDLMNLLGAYGICTSVLSDFATCGDLIEHEGYSYSTVQIGEQCWFSENCRYLPEVFYPAGGGSETYPIYFVYDYLGTDVIEAKATENYETYGVLYNWPAVMTEEICPSGWHIPSDGEWQTMEMYLGMSESLAASEGWREGPFGDYLKSPYGWQNNGNGSNSSGFGGLPGGVYKPYEAAFYNLIIYGYWWSSSEDFSNSWRRILVWGDGSIVREGISRSHGMSARCIKD